MMIRPIDFEACPYCGKPAVIETEFIWNDRDALRCGCETPGCRGNYLDAPTTYDTEAMKKKWNQRSDTYWAGYCLPPGFLITGTTTYFGGQEVKTLTVREPSGQLVLLEKVKDY